MDNDKRVTFTYFLSVKANQHAFFFIITINHFVNGIAYLHAFLLFTTMSYKSERTPKRQSTMDNPQKLTTKDKQDEEKQSKSTTQYVFDITTCK
jgi:hypothetical protein